MIYIVGIGIGNDIESLTLKAYNVIKEIDIGIYIGEMIGESIIKLFDNKLFYYGRNICKQNVHDIIQNAVQKDESVALLMPGDISFFSGQISEQYTFDEYIKWFQTDKIDFEVISGISALNALCAKASIDLTALSKTQNTFITSIERQKELNKFDINSFNKNLSTKPNIVLYQSFREWGFIKNNYFYIIT